MIRRALAVDFDGTLAHDGKVAPATVDALVRARDAEWVLVYRVRGLEGS